MDFYKVVKSVDYYKVAGLALLFWLCVSVTSLVFVTSDVQQSIRNKAIDFPQVRGGSGIRFPSQLDVRITNPVVVQNSLLNGIYKDPFRISN